MSIRTRALVSGDASHLLAQSLVTSSSRRDGRVTTSWLRVAQCISLFTRKIR